MPDTPNTAAMRAPGEIYEPRPRPDRWLDAACLVMLSHMLGPLGFVEGDKEAAFRRLWVLFLVERQRNPITGGEGWGLTPSGKIAAKALEDVMGLRA